MAAKDDLGRRGERLAEQHLVRRGALVLDRNWRCSAGEIDLVVREAGTLVFIEVKTRSGLGWGDPLEAITPVKLARLRRLAGAWCAAHPGERGPLRIDAIGVTARTGTAPTLTHVEGVF